MSASVARTAAQVLEAPRDRVAVCLLEREQWTKKLGPWLENVRARVKFFMSMVFGLSSTGQKSLDLLYE